MSDQDTDWAIRNAPQLIENLRGCMTPTAAVAANVIERLMAERAAPAPPQTCDNCQHDTVAMTCGANVRRPLLARTTTPAFGCNRWEPIGRCRGSW